MIKGISKGISNSIAVTSGVGLPSQIGNILKQGENGVSGSGYDAIVSDNYDINTGPWSVSGGNLVFNEAPGTANFNDWIAPDSGIMGDFYRHALESWKIRINYTMDIGTNLFGPGPGIRKTSSGSDNFQNMMRFPCDSNNATFFQKPIIYRNSAISGQIVGDELFKDGVSQDWSDGDSQILEIERDYQDYIIRVADGSINGMDDPTWIDETTITPGYATTTWQYPMTGRFALWCFGGAVTFQKLRIDVTAYKNCKYLLEGDSIALGWKVAFANRWSEKARAGLSLDPENFQVQAGPGDLISDCQARIGVTTQLKPKNLIICIGSNDIAAGSGTYATDLSNYLDSLESALPSTNIILCTIPARNSVDLTTANATIASEASNRGLTLVDFFDATYSGTGTAPVAGWTVDGIHYNDTGTTALSNEFLNTI